MTDIGYVAYIDEAGDDGIKRVRPVDAVGATEWFVLAAVVIRVERENEVVPWVKKILADLQQHQRRDIHFRNLPPHKKKMVCQAIAELPIRCFVVMSNKKNMRNYRNINAEKIPSRNWFYCWMSRLLLERITDFCERDSIKRHGTPRKVKLEFSRRGGMSYAQFRAYLKWIREQSRANNLYISTGDLKWTVVDADQVFFFDHKLRAGLQLADVVASAFYQAVESSPEYAELLEPRVGRKPNGNIFGYGVKIMPHYQHANLTADQCRIFEFYRKGRQALGP